MRSKYFKSILYSLFICGLAIGGLVIQANAQVTSNLTGYYQLDVTKSGNTNAIIENASRQNKLSVADKMDLQVKLNPTNTLSIKVKGQQVVLTNSNNSPTTLNADGSTQTAFGSNGTKVSIRANLISDTLKVSSLYGNTDYSITFRSLNSGRNLEITKMVKTQYLQGAVLATSFYNRTNSPNTFIGSFNNSRFSDDKFIVPSGTILAVTLENVISTESSQNNDRFRLKVTTPGAYEGAIIDGYLSNIERSNGISGTPKMTINFQKIMLANGKTFEFTGIIKSIIAPRGKIIRNNNEGRVKGQNNTNESIKRGVLGTGIGAVIGAVIGGKRGSIIGAIVGGSGATGTMLLEGNKELKLNQGSQLSIQSTSPN